MSARSVEEEKVNEEVPPRDGQVLQSVKVPPRGDEVPIFDEGMRLWWFLRP